MAADPDPPDITPDAFLAGMAAELGPAYRRCDDGCFRWLTPFADAEHARHADQAGYALSRLGEILPGIDARPDDEGRPVILFANQDDQLVYHGLFGDPDGATIIDGGCWRPWPVGHLAIPVSRWNASDSAFAHELVHAVLDSDGVPVWIQEGFATEAETRMGHRASPFAEPDELTRTLAFWRQRSADGFWSGDDFREPDASPHAYRLAQILVSRWTRDAAHLEALRSPGCEAWADQDATLRHLFGLDRPALLADVLERQKRMGVLERIVHAIFVGGGR